MDEADDILNRAADLLRRQTPLLDQRELRVFVRSYLQQRALYLEVCRKHGSPLYIIDTDTLRLRAKQFRTAFQEALPDLHLFYAVKSNNHPAVAETMVKVGLGLDVSSGVELEMALACHAAEIIFSGPGKLPEELNLAVAHRDQVTILIDSFGELDRLQQAAESADGTIRAGVRLTVDERGFWRKFGIPLKDLGRFFAAAESCPNIRLCGLQFHTSWNLDPSNQVAFIERLGAALKDLPENHRRQIAFVDIGGGYWPPQGEWLQAAGTAEGRLRQAVASTWEPSPDHFRLSSTVIEIFAQKLGQAVRTNLRPHVDCSIYAEPGRWLCHDGMHILLTVVDKKADDLVITDGGMNMIGWERFESDYFPVINLSRPDLLERECLVLGSLCTPHDIWGYGYYGADIQPGDVLLIPTQGAYTYSLRQQFIKAVPKAVILPDGDDLPE